MKSRISASQKRRLFIMAALVLCFRSGSPLFALQQSTGPGGSNVQTVHALGYTGQGVSVGLISANYARYTHEAFAGNAICYDATGLNPYNPDPAVFDPQNHDTPLAGIICSRGGALYPNDKGAAPGAFLYSVKASNGGSVSTLYITNALDYLRNQQCKVIVTGFQFSNDVTTPDGTSIWSLIYDYYTYEYNLVFATATGNYLTGVSVFGDTYNSITTGGLLVDADDVYYKVGSSSNPGPTADGRQKPEITAPSQNQWTCLPASDTSWDDASPSSGGQTSWAIPHTAGVAAVLLSYANTTTDTTDNRNEVIKAVIVNSTFPNIISRSAASTTGQTWNADRGYGRIDALKAYQTLSGAKILPGANVTAQKGWTYQTMTQNFETDTYRIQGLKNERLVLTVTWNRQVTKFLNNYNEESAPKFNLDLMIKSPKGAILFSEADTLNNLQKADILLPEDGYYTITLTNTTTKDRGYGLAFELLPPLVADFNVDYVVNDLDLAAFVLYWLDTDCLNTAQSCFDYNLSTSDAIDQSDFSIFARQWLSYDNRYYTP